jgi:hypothetical protein
VGITWGIDTGAFMADGQQGKTNENGAADDCALEGPF